MRELDYVFAQISFDDLQPRIFKSVVQVRLFGRHAFAFDNRSRAPLRRNVADYGVRILAVFCPVKLNSARFSTRDELLEILIQMT